MSRGSASLGEWVASCHVPPKTWSGSSWMKHPSHVEPCFHAAGGEYVGTTPVTLSPVWSSIVLLTEDADAQDMSAVIRRRGRRIWNREGG